MLVLLAVEWAVLGADDNGFITLRYEADCYTDNCGLLSSGECPV
jgi:hypothetical protein